MITNSSAREIDDLAACAGILIGNAVADYALGNESAMVDISNPDSTGKLRVTRFTLEEGSISCDFEGQVEGYGSVFVTHEYVYTSQDQSGGIVTGEARTFLEDGSQLTTPHGGTFTQEQSVMSLSHRSSQ